MSPTLTNTQYALLNAEDGKYFQFKHSSSSAGAKTRVVARDPDQTVEGDQQFILTVVSHSPLTVTIQSSGGPAIASLTSSSEDADLDVTVPSSTAGKKYQWIVTQSSSGIYSKFCRLKNVLTGTYLDLAHGTGPRIVGARHHSRLSQKWLFVKVPNSMKLRDRHDRKVKRRNEFLKAKQDDARDKRQAEANAARRRAQQQRPTTSNLCGNPMCGVDHICNADYNRRVRPMGYPGVPGY